MNPYLHLFYLKIINISSNHEYSHYISLFPIFNFCFAIISFIIHNLELFWSIVYACFRACIILSTCSNVTYHRGQNDIFIFSCRDRFDERRRKWRSEVQSLLYALDALDALDGLSIFAFPRTSSNKLIYDNTRYRRLHKSLNS